MQIQNWDAESNKIKEDLKNSNSDYAELKQKIRELKNQATNLKESNKQGKLIKLNLI